MALRNWAPAVKPLLCRIHAGLSTSSANLSSLDPVKIAVIGAGAMGSVYAGLLAEAGHQVWAVDLWKDHVDAIASRGLRVEGVSGDRTVRGINAVRDASEAGKCDLVIIATKASGVGPAARSITDMLHE